MILALSAKLLSCNISLGGGERNRGGVEAGDVSKTICARPRPQTSRSAPKGETIFGHHLPRKIQY